VCDVCGGNMSKSIACRMQKAITFAVMWLPWPSMTRSRWWEGSVGRVEGSNTVVSHSKAWLSDVKPLLLVENRQSAGASVGIHAVFVCFALKMNNGGMAVLAALTHSITVIHSYLPDIIFQLDFSQTLTSALDDCDSPTAKPDSSMLQTRSESY
jgi:hypothetical protein